MLLLMLNPNPTVQIQPLLQPPSTTLPLFQPPSLQLISIFLHPVSISLPFLPFRPVHAVQPFPFLCLHFVSWSSVLCDVSSGSPRPLIPEGLCQKLSLHRISHPGVCASRRLLSFRFVWPGLAKDVGLLKRLCLRCQQSKVQTQVCSPLPGIPVPGRRFSHVHLDLVGPLPSSQGFCYVLTMINRTPRWPEDVPLSTITAESCARAFISSWVARFGVPALLSSFSVSPGSRQPVTILRVMR